MKRQIEYYIEKLAYFYKQQQQQIFLKFTLFTQTYLN